jgi:hypothetical protein
MNERRDATTSTDGESMLDRLRELLEQQLELVHQGRLAAAEGLCEQTVQCVQAITDARVLDTPGGEDRRESLTQLYNTLCLTLTAEREETWRELKTIRHGKRVLKTYGKHVSTR